MGVSAKRSETGSYAALISSYQSPAGLEGKAMFRFILGVLLVAAMGLHLSGCSEDARLPGETLESAAYLGHIDHGCAGQDQDLDDCEGTAFLKGFEFHADTLTLTIHFEANCCPEFVEQVVFEGDSIDIEVLDILYECDCICPFENEFAFLYAGTGDLWIHFRSLQGSGDYCVAAFDTMITLPR
jgi:hypothetical protein